MQPYESTSIPDRIYVVHIDESNNPIQHGSINSVATLTESLMRIHPSRFLTRIVIVLVFNSGWNNPAIAYEPSLSEFKNCVVEDSAGGGQARGQCAWLTVPENYNTPHGRQIELRVFRLGSLAQRASPDAVTFIQGGPGGSSVELAAGLRLVSSTLRHKRDVFLMDQRGTGQSAALNCDFKEIGNYELLPTEELISATQECASKLGANADLKQYTTSVAIRDLEHLRIQLGYQQWNIIAGSYGTRVALHYMRRYPENVRTAVLEGLVPPQNEIISTVANNAQTALDELFAQCTSQDSCIEQFPRLKEDFAQLLRALEKEPREVQLDDPTTGEDTELSFGSGALTLVVRMMLYAPETRSLIPLMIQQASEGDLRPMAAQAIKITRQFAQSLSDGMHNSVICAEDFPRLKLDKPSRKRIATTFLGSNSIDAMQTVCEPWPEGLVDADFFEPIVSNIPTLLISGEFDPITPASNATLVARSMSNALHLIAPGQGHSLYSAGCVRRMSNEFIKSADTDKVDTACLQRMYTRTFFTSNLGMGQ